MTARKQLTSTRGQGAGKIHYGDRIEEGGELSGDAVTISGAKASTAGAPKARAT
jgi:hypothetical protein